MNLFEERNVTVFNSPLEIGLRILFILDELFPESCDLQRLVYYDYILVHSGDAPGGPASIHPSLPHRSSEILVKRELVKRGLTLMNSKQLVKCDFDSTGIVYSATEFTKPFLEYYQTDYAIELKNVSKWILGSFGSYTDDNLSTFIKNNLDVWGGEFSKESLLRGNSDE